MLLLCSGLIIVFGVVQMSLNAKQQSMATFNVAYANSINARNTSNSGMERAINRIMDDPTWRTDAGPWTIQFGDWPVVITSVDNSTDPSLGANDVRITATCVINGATEQSIAVLQRGIGLPIPEVEGAMGIFTDNLDLSISGSAFLITGNDTNADGSAGTEPPLPGMSVSSLAAYTEIFSSLNASQRARVQGSGGSPAVQLDPTMDNSALQDFFDAIIANPDEYYAGNHTASGVGSLGTPEDPKIIVVDGTLSVSNATGAGILVITESGSLDARGNFDNYQGLILIQGSADMTRGNIHIYGAMMFGGSNPSLEIDIDFRGNVSVNYSSSALQFAQQLANSSGGGGGSTNYSIVSIYD
jgi:hypothetical protein